MRSADGTAGDQLLLTSHSTRPSAGARFVSLALADEFHVRQTRALIEGPAMHKSRLGTVVIDCQTEQVDAAADYRSGGPAFREAWRPSSFANQALVGNGGTDGPALLCRASSTAGFRRSRECLG